VSSPGRHLVWAHRRLRRPAPICPRDKGDRQPDVPVHRKPSWSPRLSAGRQQQKSCVAPAESARASNLGPPSAPGRASGGKALYRHVQDGECGRRRCWSRVARPQATRPGLRPKRRRGGPRSSREGESHRCASRLGPRLVCRSGLSRRWRRSRHQFQLTGRVPHQPAQAANPGLGSPARTTDRCPSDTLSSARHAVGVEATGRTSRLVPQRPQARDRRRPVCDRTARSESTWPGK